MLPTTDLPLEKLKDPQPGMTSVAGHLLYENCLVRLSASGHQSGVSLGIAGGLEAAFRVTWSTEITDQMRRTWADPRENVELAACGLSILVISELTDYVVVERALQGTGIDYWLGYKTDEFPYFKRARLEVSGIVQARNNSEIRLRLRQKQIQSELTASTSPIYVSVVEFSQPVAYVERFEPNS